MTHKPLSVYAMEIRADMSEQKGAQWRRKFYAAVPYLEAMQSLNQITDKYLFDSGDSIVAYFLSNATTWRGDVARQIKEELKAILKGESK